MSKIFNILQKKEGIGAATYELNVSAISIAEGEQLTTTVNTTSIDDGDTILISFIGNEISASDFTDGLLTNTVTVTNNQAILTKTIAASLSDLNPENFTVQVRRTLDGRIVAESENITILGETFDVTASTYSVNEGAGVTFTVAAPNTSDGVALDLEFSGTGITASDFQDNTLTNRITVNNGTASFMKFISSSDAVEDNETISVQVRSVETNQILANLTTNVTINTQIHPFGEAIFTSTYETHNWTVPDGVTSIAVLLVGAGGTGGNRSGTSDFLAGGGGGGGGLAYRNNLVVTPGQNIAVTVGGAVQGTISGGTEAGNGNAGEFSRVVAGSSTIIAYGGVGGDYDDGNIFSEHPLGGDGGYADGDYTARYQGGKGGMMLQSAGGGGGGAAGYSGNGGLGGPRSSTNPAGGGSGSGGGGGGGGSGYTSVGADGGGVGIFGRGSSGSGGGVVNESGTIVSYGGGGGSGGVQGKHRYSTYTYHDPNIRWGEFGGGGGGASGGGSGKSGGGPQPGANGVVRIIWGENPNERAFPTTNTSLEYSQGHVYKF